MGEFKAGDIVYHKATLERGVISSIHSDGELHVAWKSGKKEYHTKEELWTEAEFKEKYPRTGRVIKTRFR